MDRQVLVTVAGSTGSGKSMVGALITKALKEAGILDVQLIEEDTSPSALTRFCSDDNVIKHILSETAVRIVGKQLHRNHVWIHKLPVKPITPYGYTATYDINLQQIIDIDADNSRLTMLTLLGQM